MYNSIEKAVTLQKVEKNLCAGVTIKGKVAEKTIEFIESENIAKFLKSAYEYGYIYWLFYKLLIETGL
ncbi:integrase [Bacillus sp. Bva_UNVM-123]|uniref:integrase n=1 Tax=Bacillus sp. Bva_UNVM-123 TaxID=2829798 RepID=UPI00391F5265